MNDTIVRIESIEIKNFKNVGYGHLDFGNSKKGYKASILGLYGQNGSDNRLFHIMLGMVEFTAEIYFVEYGINTPFFLAAYLESILEGRIFSIWSQI